MRDSGLSGREGDNCLKDVILPYFLSDFMLWVLIDYKNGSNFRGRTEEDLYITSKIIYSTVNKGDSRYEFSCTNLT